MGSFSLVMAIEKYVYTHRSISLAQSSSSRPKGEIAMERHIVHHTFSSSSSSNVSHFSIEIYARERTLVVVVVVAKLRLTLNPLLLYPTNTAIFRITLFWMFLFCFIYFPFHTAILLRWEASSSLVHIFRTFLFSLFRFQLSSIFTHASSLILP